MEDRENGGPNNVKEEAKTVGVRARKVREEAKEVRVEARGSRSRPMTSGWRSK